MCCGGRHDAVLVGVGTAADKSGTDRPDHGFRPGPVVRVIVDSHLRTPLIAAGADRCVALWFLVRDGVDPARRDAFTGIGAKVIDVAQAPPGSN